MSRKVCILMVKNINKISKTDLSISITGIAGPSGGTDLKPIGLVFVGIKNKKKIICEKFLFKKKERSFIQKEAVKKSLKLMLKHIN